MSTSTLHSNQGKLSITYSARVYREIVENYTIRNRLGRTPHQLLLS